MNVTAYSPAAMAQAEDRFNQVANNLFKSLGEGIHRLGANVESLILSSEVEALERKRIAAKDRAHVLRAATNDNRRVITSMDLGGVICYYGYVKEGVKDFSITQDIGKRIRIYKGHLRIVAAHANVMAMIEKRGSNQYRAGSEWLILRPHEWAEVEITDDLIFLTMYDQ